MFYIIKRVEGLQGDIRMSILDVKLTLKDAEKTIRKFAKKLGFSKELRDKNNNLYFGAMVDVLCIEKKTFITL